MLEVTQPVAPNLLPPLLPTWERAHTGLRGERPHQDGSPRGAWRTSDGRREEAADGGPGVSASCLSEAGTGPLSTRPGDTLPSRSAQSTLVWPGHLQEPPVWRPQPSACLGQHSRKGDCPAPGPEAPSVQTSWPWGACFFIRLGLELEKDPLRRTARLTRPGGGMKPRFQSGLSGDNISFPFVLL